MANSYIRIYDKPNNEGTPATWLGLSATPASDLRQKETEFFDFFHRNGHTINEVDAKDTINMQRIRALGGVSWSYMEVVPPLPDELFTELGKVCELLVEPESNSGVLIDNRNDPFPTTPYSSASKVVNMW
jgi:hypothetical protein